MKKVILLSFIIILTPFFVFAHPGNTDSSGCHTCRTNCTSWGLSYGEYHCHNTKSYSSPSYSYPTTPTCPSLSTYNSLSGSCECIYGYVVGKDFLGNEACVSASSECRNRYGLWSSYNSLDKVCECSSGYIMGYDILGKKSCISADSQCREQLGNNSRYNSTKKVCECSYDYVISNGKCVTNDEYCHDIFGYGSKNNVLTDKCECKEGYVFNGTKCEYDTNSSYSNSSASDLQNNNCPENSTKSLLDKCTCNTGYIANTAKDGCIKRACPLFSELVGDSCVCNVGYSFDSINKICIEAKKCGINQVLINDDCYCSQGYSFNIDKTSCIKNVQYITSNKSINIREKANATSKIIGQIKKNIKYQITDLSNKDWVKIKYSATKEGWVLKRLINTK